MAFPKSVRSIEIEQQTRFGFTEDYVEKLIRDHRTSIDQYAWILHDLEGENHIHCMLWFRNPQPTENLLKWLDGVCTLSQLEKIKKDESAQAYLTHANRPNKVQYPVEKVHTNIANFEEVTERVRKLNAIAPILDGIRDGTITERDIFKIENLPFYVKNKKRIDDAFLFRNDCVRLEVLRMEKNIDVIFVDGESRTGKTSYIIEQCKANNISYCKSSSSNDILQDYKDEQILILDDLRDDALKLADFLKFTDPHYRTTTQSRYHNKCFVGEVIYITTTKPLEQWYAACKDEQRLQFTSRIKTHMHFTRDSIELYRHEDDVDTKPFVLELCVPNMMADKFVKARRMATEVGAQIMSAIREEAEKAKQQALDSDELPASSLRPMSNADFDQMELEALSADEIPF